MIMSNKMVLALVVSSSDSLQDGLLALMTTIPQVSAVLVAEDVSSTLRMVANHQPGLVVLDLSLPQIQDVIMQIKAQYPRIQLIVLAEDITQGEAAGALRVDHVLIKGFSAQKLVTIVEKLTLNLEESHHRSAS